MSVMVPGKLWKALPAARKFRLLQLLLFRLKQRLKREGVKGPYYFAVDMLQTQERLMVQEYERFQYTRLKLSPEFEKETERWLESTLKLRKQMITEFSNKNQLNEASKKI